MNKSEAHRIYKIKESYFDFIDNEYNAYFLGLLFADGCNTGKNITLSLSGEDYYLLDIFHVLSWNEKISCLIGKDFGERERES